MMCSSAREHLLEIEVRAVLQDRREGIWNSQGKSGQRGEWDAVRVSNWGRQEGLEVLFVGVMRCSLCTEPCCTWRWRTSCGFDVIGTGNTEFAFEETLHHYKFHNYQTARTVESLLPLLAFPWCYPGVKLAVNTPRAGISHQLHHSVLQ